MCTLKKTKTSFCYLQLIPLLVGMQISYKLEKYVEVFQKTNQIINSNTFFKHLFFLKII